MGKKKYKLSASSNTNFQQDAKRADLPMALTVTPNLTTWTDADSGSSAGWEVEQAAAGSGINTAEEFQGNGCFSMQTKSAGVRSGAYYNSGVNTDLTGEIVRVWARFTETNKYSGHGTEGIRLYIEDGNGDFSEWTIGGADTINEDWNNYAVDISNTVVNNDNAGTPADLTIVRKIGIIVLMNTKPSRADNIFIDAIRYGPGLTITGTNTTTDDGFSEIADADENKSNKYGIFRRGDGGSYLLSGKLVFGDSGGTGSVDFTDNQNSKILIRDNTLRGGQLQTSGTLGISIVGNGTGTTDFQMGSVLGTGDDRQGVLGGLISSEVDKFTFDSETDTSDIDSCNLYGITFENAGVIQIAGSTTQEAIGCSFIRCGEIQPNTSEFLNNLVVSPSPNRGVEMIASHAIKQIEFVASGDAEDIPVELAWRVDIDVAETSPARWLTFTSAINSATANDVLVFPTVEAIGDYFTIASTHQFSKLKINVGTARSGGSIAWEYWDGSSWGALDVISDGTFDLSATGTKELVFNAPTDWAPIGDFPTDPALYIVRIRCVTTMTTNPLITQAWISNIQENHVHAPVAGTFTVTGLNFTGFANNQSNTENSANATTCDSYPESNFSNTLGLNATYSGHGQSFTGNGEILSNARFYIQSNNSPTGNIVAKLYAHSGTFGTSSVPTGAALATSNNVDASTIPAALTLIDFEFEDEVTLTNTTKYVITIEYSNGDATDFINVAMDDSSPTHGGNSSNFIASWAAASSADLIFFVYTNAIVKFNAADSNVASDNNTGVGPGATIIVFPVNISVHAVDADDNTDIENARVYIEADTGGDLAVGTPILSPDSQLTNSSGIVTDTHTYTSDQPIVGRVRKSTASPLYKTSTFSGTITLAGFTVTTPLVKDE